MRLRVVSWNVDSRPNGLLDAKLDLLSELEPDVALLQEISRSVFRALLPHPSVHERMHLRSRPFNWGALSTDLCRPRGSEHRLGCAVLGGSATALVNSHVLNGVPFEVRDPIRLGFLWRTAVARVALSTGHVLTAGSFHGRPRAGPPPAELQRAFHAGIAGWLATVAEPVVFGIDASPAGFEDVDPLVGPDPSHGLIEALNACRDQLWASPDMHLTDVGCLADAAAAAGSEHPVLVADFDLNT